MRLNYGYVVSTVDTRNVEVIMVRKAETNASFATCGPRWEYNKLDRKK